MSAMPVIAEPGSNLCISLVAHLGGFSLLE